MKHRITGIIIGLMICALPGSSYSESKIPQAGDEFPSISLALSETSISREYLGVTGSKLFKISDIKADAVIIQIFSMYCPHCQKEAPNVNRLFEKLSQHPDLKDKIKLIGIGTGNSAYEVAVFQKKYQIQFPLFEDPDFTIHNRVGEARTPYFFGVKSDGAKKTKVFFSKLGGFDDPERFLNEIASLSGIKKGGAK
ncbi:MAG: TlpA disulfide reductase family protein [Thermodesulfobacteriota bacterium]